MHCEEVDNVGRRGGAQRTNTGQLPDLGCESTRSIAITTIKTVTSRRPIAASQVYHSVSMVAPAFRFVASVTKLECRVARNLYRAKVGN